MYHHYSKLLHTTCMFDRKLSYTPEVFQSERREHLLCRTLLMLISNYRNKITVWGVSKLVWIGKPDVVSFMNEIKIYFDSCLLWRWNCEWGCEGAFYVWEFHFQLKQKESYNKNRQGEKCVTSQVKFYVVFKTYWYSMRSGGRTRNDWSNVSISTSALFVLMMILENSPFW